MKPITFRDLVNHYIDHELPRASRSTRLANQGFIKNWIEPAWHQRLAFDMRTMEIEEWLHALPRPDGTKQKIKGIMSTIFTHGVRWELVERNPEVSGLKSSKQAPISWHCFRRSLATLLVSNGENVKVTQS